MNCKLGLVTVLGSRQYKRFSRESFSLAPPALLLLLRWTLPPDRPPRVWRTRTEILDTKEEMPFTTNWLQKNYPICLDASHFGPEISGDVMVAPAPSPAGCARDYVIKGPPPGAGAPYLRAFRRCGNPTHRQGRRRYPQPRRLDGCLISLPLKRRVARPPPTGPRDARRRAIRPATRLWPGAGWRAPRPPAWPAPFP